MSKFDELMASLATKRAEKSAKDKKELLGGVTTSDNKEVDASFFDCVKMILAGCTVSLITDMGKDELFDRLTKNFIKANTEEDLQRFISHNLTLKLVDILVR